MSGQFSGADFAIGSRLRRSGSLASHDDVERGHTETEASETNAREGYQAILRLTHEQGLSVREVSERLKISKTTVSTYLLRAREAGLSCWPKGRSDGKFLVADAGLFTEGKLHRKFANRGPVQKFFGTVIGRKIECGLRGGR